ncbi:MAG: tetratricopeptide repeat protein [Gammaproteobacteria bacterium]
MQTAAWVARTDVSSIDPGLDTEKARTLARDFLAQLRERRVAAAKAELDDAALDVLHAAIEVVASASAQGLGEALEDASRLHEFLSTAKWPAVDFGEKQELLDACALWAWRLARRAGKPQLAQEWAGRAGRPGAFASQISHDFRSDPVDLPGRPITPENGRAAALRVLGLPFADRAVVLSPRQVEEPEVLLGVCAELRSRLDASPVVVRDEAEFFYGFLSEPKRPIGLFDEREYFLGELALLAGSASRALARREECSRWFARAEANFRLTVNAVADWSRVSYQRLALLLEERKFDDLMDQLPSLVESFEKLDMAEEVLKCRSLEGLAHMETGDATSARDVFCRIREGALRLNLDRLVASACVNLVHVEGALGDAEAALRYSREALPILRRLKNNVALAQVQTGIGTLFRSRNNAEEAIEAFRSAQEEFAGLGMMADVAAIRLIVADLLLESGQERLAAEEVLEALPIIEEYKMVPEGMAALGLLRESLRQQKVNHQALRDLHGFFEETVS